MRDVEPGEIVVDRPRRRGAACARSRPSARRFCIFEYVYFARPDSVVEGKGVYEVRKRIGAELARESGGRPTSWCRCPTAACRPPSATPRRPGLPFELGIIRNHYVGRTFIEPSDQIRNLGVRLKHNANRRSLEGKRVVLVDDSIVRGTTSTKIVEHGPRRRAPPRSTCGSRARPPRTAASTASTRPSAASCWRRRHSVEEMAADHRRRQPGLPLDRRPLPRGRRGAAATRRPQYCDACFTGDYPTRLADIEGELGGRQLTLLLEDA